MSSPRAFARSISRGQMVTPATIAARLDATSLQVLRELHLLLTDGPIARMAHVPTRQADSSTGLARWSADRCARHSFAGDSPIQALALQAYSVWWFHGPATAQKTSYCGVLMPSGVPEINRGHRQLLGRGSVILRRRRRHEEPGKLTSRRANKLTQS